MFANWARGNNSHPGGQGGGDWSITAEGEGKNRRYTTGFLRSAPFTQEELKRIKKEGELYTLKEMYKATPLSEVVQKAFGERAGGTSEPDPDSEPPKGTEEGVGEDDPINW